jgi:outer membrane lipoprotein-sorting protein
MKRLAVVVQLFLICLSQKLLAQTPVSSTGAKDPAAVALAQKSFLAMGGTAVSGYQDMVGTGSVVIYGGDGPHPFPAKLSFKGTRKQRYEISKETGLDVFVSDGTASCITRADGTQQPGAPQNLYAQRVDIFPVLSLLGEFSNSNVNVQYAGSATINGQLDDIVSLSLSISSTPYQVDGLKATQHLFYINRNSQLVDKVEFAVAGNNETDVSWKYEWYFSDYRMAGGFLVPFRRSAFLDGKKSSDLALSTVTFNQGLLDSEFVVNCGGTNGN